MFEHPGKKIKTTAKVFSVLLVVFGLIGGFVIGTDNKSFGLFLVIVLGALGCAILTGLFLYGFGTLIESTEANEENTRQILELLRERPRLDSVPGPAPKPGAKNKGPVAPIPQVGDREKCPVCMTIQRAGRSMCEECGVPFIRE